MRIPVIPDLSTKDGAANQNARMTNVLVQRNQTGTNFAAVRPSLSLAATGSGAGNGLVLFNNQLLAVFADGVKSVDDSTLASVGTVQDSFFDFTQSV